MSGQFAENDALTEADRDALACRCHEGICPLHNEASDGYVEFQVDVLLGLVEQIVAAGMAEAWERGAYAGREYQKDLIAWGRGLSIGKVPTMRPNPYCVIPPAKPAPSAPELLAGDE